MERLLGRFTPYIFALLRIIAGIMFMLHGTQKLFVFPGGRGPVPIASLAGVAGVIEIVCGFLIAIGLFASFAAFLASGEMAVAYFKAHAPQSFWPVINQGELAVLYCFLFLYIAAHGAGVWSVDSAFRRTRRT
jgi:putative oxidoreductase